MHDSQENNLTPKIMKTGLGINNYEHNIIQAALEEFSSQTWRPNRNLGEKLLLQYA